MIEWAGGHPVAATALLTLLIEAVTAIGRFACGVRSTRDTCAVAPFTAGLRIHHCYVGVAVAALAPVAGAPFLCVGVALVASDLIHHFLVLWPVTGDHEFDLTYPPRGV